MLHGAVSKIVSHENEKGRHSFGLYGNLNGKHRFDLREWQKDTARLSLRAKKVEIRLV